jgi:hypothetical protein
VLRERNVFAVNDAKYRENQVCLVVGRAGPDNTGVVPLMSCWGGEAIYMVDSDSEASPAFLGRPAVVVAAVDLSVSHTVSPTFTSLGRMFVDALLGTEHRVADVLLRTAVPAGDILAIWQPGDPSTRRCRGVDPPFLLHLFLFYGTMEGTMAEGLSSELVLRLVGEAAARRDEAERHFREMLVTARAANIPLNRIAEVAGLSTSRIHAIVGEEHELMSALTATYERPRPSTPDDDVLVVAGGKIAVADYLRHAAYICQPERSFRDVERIGFYRNGQIEPFFPRIRYRRRNIEWTRANAQALRQTGAALDVEIADVIDRTLDDPADPRREGWKYQAFLLTPRDDAQTLTLAQPVKHRTLGRGTAWTQGTRYASEEALRRNPETTDELR